MSSRESAHRENMLSAISAAASSAKRSEQLLRQLVEKANGEGHLQERAAIIAFGHKSLNPSVLGFVKQIEKGAHL